MGIVWEAYHKGVPLLGVPGITLDPFQAPASHSLCVNWWIYGNGNDSPSLGKTEVEKLRCNEGNHNPKNKQSVIWLGQSIQKTFYFQLTTRLKLMLICDKQRCNDSKSRLPIPAIWKKGCHLNAKDPLIISYLCDLWSPWYQSSG